MNITEFSAEQLYIPVIKASADLSVFDNIGIRPNLEEVRVKRRQNLPIPVDGRKLTRRIVNTGKRYNVYDDYSNQWRYQYLQQEHSKREAIFL